MGFGSLRGRCVLFAAPALGLMGLAPAAAEAKRIKIRARLDPGGAWSIGRAAVATPGRAEAPRRGRAPPWLPSGPGRMPPRRGQERRGRSAARLAPAAPAVC